ncbi:MAG: NF038122 family metalloprotease [Xanthobacteraceae bacterium]
MNINVSFDQNTARLPSGCVAAVDYVAGFFDSLFTNPVTINIDVRYGEINGAPLGRGNLGESEVLRYARESYGSVVSTLQSEGAPGSSTLPGTSPLSGRLSMTPAEAQALGLRSAVSTSYVGFSSTAHFSYAINATPPAGQYYFVGVVEHEFTEDMGRISLIGGQPFRYSPMDLFRYSSPGVRDVATGSNGSTAYFSINNGSTDLGSWNNQISNGDLGDWYGNNIPNSGNDAFNDYSSSGVLNALSPTDLTLMESIGWTVAPTATVTGQNFKVPEFHAVELASYISVSDPRGDAITRYGFYDAGGTSNGHLMVNGVAQPGGQWISVSTSELGSVQYVGGSSPGQQSLYVEVFDASTGSWSAYTSFTARTIAATPPTVEVQNVRVPENESIAAASLITSVSNPDGDSLTQYGFFDAGGNNNGHFALNGAAEPNGQWIYASTGDLSSLTYDGGSSPGHQALYVEVYDASTNQWSAASSLTARTTTAGASLDGGMEHTLGYTGVSRHGATSHDSLGLSPDLFGHSHI